MFRRFCGGRVLLFPLTIVCLLFAPYPSLAISPEPGWVGGVNLEGDGKVIYSSPAIADIDGNTENGLEIVVGTADGYLHALSADGTQLWRSPLPNATCSGSSSSNKLLSSPALGALYGDGVMYAVVGYGGVGGKDCGGGVAAFNAVTGERKWNFSHKKYNDNENYWSFSYTVFSTPSLFDTNGDGTLEIGYGSFDRRVYLLAHTGVPIWTAIVADTVWSSVAFAFIDGESRASMLAGTDISKNTALRPPTPNGGYFYRFRTTSGSSASAPKKKKKGCKRYKKGSKKRKRCRRRKKKNASLDLRAGTTSHGFRDPDAFHYYKEHNQVFYSSPVVSDILPNRNGLEVVTGFGCFFPQDSSNKRGKKLIVMRADTGAVLRTIPAPGCNESSPTVADLDGDGQPEIIATFNVSSAVGGNNSGQLAAFNPATGEKIWQVASDQDGSDGYASFKYSAIAGDLNGDGGQEIVAMNAGFLRIYDGASGALLTCSGNSCAGGNARIKINSAGRNTPAIADLNGDGTLELIAASGGKVYVFSDFSDLEGATPGANEPYTASHPMWRVDAARTGSVSRP